MARRPLDKPDMTHAQDGRLYHATTLERARAALAEGVQPHLSYWAVQEIAEYFQETIDDENDEDADDGQGVLISAPLTAFDRALLREDTPGYEEPITTVIGCSEKDVHHAWRHDPKAWQRSYDQIGSVAYEGGLSASDLRLEDY